MYLNEERNVSISITFFEFIVLFFKINRYKIIDVILLCELERWILEQN